MRLDRFIEAFFFCLKQRCLLSHRFDVDRVYKRFEEGGLACSDRLFNYKAAAEDEFALKYNKSIKKAGKLA